jgi:hypothetical protein
LEGCGNGVVQNEVVDLVLLRGIWRRGVEPVDLDSAVVTGGREVLVGWVECYALDVTLVV